MGKKVGNHMKKLDKIDEEIIAQLRNNASITSAELAAELGMSASGVRRRVRNLKKSGAIRTIVIPQSLITGSHSTVLIALNTEIGKAEHVALRLSEYPQIYMVARSLGRFDIMSVAHFGSTSDVTNFLDQELPLIEGILSTETFTLSKLPKSHGIVW